MLSWRVHLKVQIFFCPFVFFCVISQFSSCFFMLFLVHALILLHHSVPSIGINISNPGYTHSNLCLSTLGVMRRSVAQWFSPDGGRYSYGGF